MKKINVFIVALLFFPALFLSSCDRGDDINPENPILEPAFTTMKKYMIDSDLDLTNVLSGPGGEVKFVAGAPAEADLDAFLAKYSILDIRTAEAFNTGHIQGAKNIAFADILTEADMASKQILVVCYTGQTACYAASLLRLAGHSNAQALKWGMSGWNPATAGSWNNNTGDEANGHTNWSFTNPPTAQVHEDPFIDIISTDGAEILRQRVEKVVENGFKTAKGTDVLNAPQNYFVNNYFSDTDYGKFGHIAEAERVKDELMLAGDGYKGLDPDKNAKVITYCYTGQTSAVVTAWLNVLGYDAYSMTFGMNGIYHSNPAWSTNQWGVGSSVPKNLPLVQ
jgi:rhodanese-related sulfurtransferase